ncbi:MAG: D-aminoacyl-tRNA deacylase [Spirochaetales bacterium]|nr:D-aminoacyl-tRNA deacylase [Spirochaetales bacterium]
MKAVIQAVKDAKCTVGDRITGEIDEGLLIYFCVEKGDSEKMLPQFLDKILKLRLYRDENERANFSIMDMSKKILFISQFTLAASLRKGNRPSFDNAAPPDLAKDLYIKAMEYLRSKGVEVGEGEFGAHMAVSYTNCGPQTFIWEMEGDNFQ